MLKSSRKYPLYATGELEIFAACLSANDWHHIHLHLQRLCLPQITEIAKTAQATSQIKPGSPTKAPHPSPTSVPNVASYSRIRRVSKSIKHPSTSENRTYQPPLDSGLATLTPDVKPVNQGCSIPPSAAQIMAIKHIIKQPMTCKTKNVCYLINCKKCHQQYTGETQLQFHKRMNNHTSDIRQKKKSMGMVRHFAKCGLNNVQPIILERVRSSDPFIRKAREQFYINIFGTEINAQ